MDTDDHSAADAATKDYGRKRTQRTQRKNFFSLCSLRSFAAKNLREKTTLSQIVVRLTMNVGSFTRWLKQSQRPAAFLIGVHRWLNCAF
jgi:hypothetical protein